MKPITIILSLLVATLAGVTSVSLITESDAADASDRVKKEAIEQIREMSAKVTAANRRSSESEIKAKAASEKLDTYKNSVAGLETANGEITKHKTKFAELEKALSESAARIAELTADLGRARDGSELQVQTEKATKLEAEIEAVSATAREATKANEALLEENIRLKAKTNLFENPSSPDYRAL
jgi:chromosome segregation ATPase